MGWVGSIRLGTGTATITADTVEMEAGGVPSGRRFLPPQQGRLVRGAAGEEVTPIVWYRVALFAATTGSGGPAPGGRGEEDYPRWPRPMA